MSTELASRVQEFLTVDGREILSISDLLDKHTPEKIESLLSDLITSRMDTVQDYLVLDITSGEIDKSISEWFRFHMALNELKGKHKQEEVIP
jgi:hypothetical protein